MSQMNNNKRYTHLFDDVMEVARKFTSRQIKANESALRTNCISSIKSEFGRKKIQPRKSIIVSLSLLTVLLFRTPCSICLMCTYVYSKVRKTNMLVCSLDGIGYPYTPINSNICTQKVNTLTCTNYFICS